MRKTVTLPKQTWDKILALTGDEYGGISDALFFVVELGLKALESESSMDSMLGYEDEDEAPKLDALTEKSTGLPRMVNVDYEELEEES